MGSGSRVAMNGQLTSQLLGLTAVVANATTIGEISRDS